LPPFLSYAGDKASTPICSVAVLEDEEGITYSSK
jgi:hypothetical protein